MDSHSTRTELELHRSGEPLPPFLASLYEEEDANLKAAIAQKAAELDALRRKDALRDALRAPIRKLPSEILLLIFSFTDVESMVSVDGTRPRLGRVCKRWRDLVCSCPSLWSCIRIVTTREPDPESLDGLEYSYYNDTTDITYLAQAIQLSQPLPLKVELCAWDDWVEDAYKTMNDAVNILVHTGRVRSVTLRGAPLSGFLDKLVSELSHLESLHLRFESDVDSAEEETLKLPTSLRRLHFKAQLPTAFNFNGPLPPLTSFDGGFQTEQECYNVLRGLPTLESLSIQHIGVSPVLPAGSSPVVLPQLRRLELSMCAIRSALSAIEAPVLDELGIDHRKWNTYLHDGARWEATCELDTPALKDVLLRRLATVRTFKFACHSVHGRKEADPVVVRIPNDNHALTKVDVSLTPYGGGNDFELCRAAFEAALTATELSFSWVADSQCKVLAEFFETRHARCRLERVTLQYLLLGTRILPGKCTTFLVPALRRLRQDGVVVEILDEDGIRVF